MTNSSRPLDHQYRSVTASISADVSDVAGIAISVAVADDYTRVDEQLSVRLDGSDIDVVEVAAEHNGRLHLLEDVRQGHLVIEYQAMVLGGVPTARASDLEVFQYMRPSRYCESDRMGPMARSMFAGLEGTDLLDGVSSWVGSNIYYVPGSSRPIDGAVATLLAREGVCRDFAHLTTALLRANDVAARVVSVYAPGLDPMDFHAVTEACIDGVWCVVDPTCLAPRGSMVRIATGADASDVAFFTNLRGLVELTSMNVTAVAGHLPVDDVTALTSLG